MFFIKMQLIILFTEDHFLFSIISKVLFYFVKQFQFKYDRFIFIFVFEFKMSKRDDNNLIYKHFLTLVLKTNFRISFLLKTNLFQHLTF